MTQSQTKTKSEGTIKVLKYIKSLFISFIVTFAAIIIFAFIIKLANIPDKAIGPVNLIIKAVSVFLGTLVLTKNGTKGLVNGVLFAFVYTAIAFTIFSLLAGEFVLGFGLISDFAFNAIAGAIGGIIGANIKK